MNFPRALDRACLRDLLLTGEGYSTVQHLPGFFSQCFYQKRFLQEMNPFIENAVMRNDIGCVAGHEDAPESRFEATQFVSEVFAVHSRHHPHR